MSVEFEAIFIAVGVHDVDLGVLKVHGVFVEGMAVHAAAYFVLEVFCRGLPHADSSLRVGANLE